MLARTVRLTNTPEREFGPAISPDGTWIAYYSDARGPTDILVKYLDSGATLNLTKSLDVRLPSRTNLGGLAISPDGKSLAFFGTQDLKEAIYDTWVLPAPLGGFPRRLLQGMQGAQWSPDGQSLACILPGSSLGDALIVTGADGSNPKQLVRAGAGVHIHWPTWAADGRSIYFIRTYQPWNIEQSEIYRVAVGGGSPEPVVRSIRRAVYPVPLPGGDLIFSANPDGVDLGLWWQAAAGGDARRLSAGLGEYAEARVSRDGRRLVSMVLEMRQSLVSLNVSDGTPVVQPLTDGYGGDIDPSLRPERRSHRLQLDPLGVSQPLDVASGRQRREAADVRHGQRSPSGVLAGRPPDRVRLRSRRPLGDLAHERGRRRRSAPDQDDRAGLTHLVA